MEPTQTTPEGATGETPETAPAGGSQDINLDELVDSLPAPVAAVAPKGLDPDFLQKLEKLDPGELPDGLRVKLEKPFLSLNSKKTTEWDGERQRLLGMIERLTNQPKAGAVEPTVDEKETLRQRIAEGDLTAIEQLVDQRFEAKYGPTVEGVKMDNVYRAAHHNFPEIATMEPQVAEVLKANPGVSFVIKSVTQRDPQLAGVLLAGVAKNIAYDQLKTQFDTLKSSQKEVAKQAIEEYKKRIAGLPSSGFRGGTTPTGGPATTNMSLREAMEAAWNEAGGS